MHMDLLRRSANFRIRCVFLSSLAIQLFRALGAPSFAETCYWILFIAQWIGLCSLLVNLFTYSVFSFARPTPYKHRLRSAFIELAILLVPLGIWGLELLVSSRAMQYLALFYAIKLSVLDFLLPWFSQSLKYILKKHPVKLRIGLIALITALTTYSYPETGIVIAFTIFVALVRVDQVAQTSVEMMGSRNIALVTLSLVFSFSMLWFPEFRGTIFALVSKTAFEGLFRSIMNTTGIWIAWPYHNVILPMAKRQWVNYAKLTATIIKRAVALTLKRLSVVLNGTLSGIRSYGNRMILAALTPMDRSWLPQQWSREGSYGVSTLAIQALAFAASYYARKYRLEANRSKKCRVQARQDKLAADQTLQSITASLSFHAQELTASESRASALKGKTRRETYCVAWNCAAARAGSFVESAKYRRMYELLKVEFSAMAERAIAMERESLEKQHGLRKELDKERDMVSKLAVKQNTLLGYLSGLKNYTASEQPSLVVSMDVSLKKAERRIAELEREAEESKMIYINGINDLQTIADSRRIQILNLEARLKKRVIKMRSMPLDAGTRIQRTRSSSAAGSHSPAQAHADAENMNENPWLSRRVSHLTVELRKTMIREMELREVVQTQKRELDGMKAALAQRAGASASADGNCSALSASETLASSSGIVHGHGGASATDDDSEAGDEDAGTPNINDATSSVCDASDIGHSADEDEVTAWVEHVLSHAKDRVSASRC